MSSDVNDLIGLPQAQQRIQDTCYHPTGTFVPFPREALEQSIPQRFEQIVRWYPDRLAVKDQHETLTYAELNERANRVAHAIVLRHGQESAPITVLTEHGVSAIVAILGILKAGKAYVPLALSYPKMRLRAIIDHTRSRVLVTTARERTHVDALVADPLAVIAMDQLDSPLLNSPLPAHNPAVSLSSDALASLYYTSGSTGMPKGVMLSHRTLLHQILNYTNRLHLCSDDRLSLLSDSSFSASAVDIFGALLNGASVYPLRLSQASAHELSRWLKQRRITIFRTVPTALRTFIDTLVADNHFPDLRVICLGSETLYTRDVERTRLHVSEHCIFVNVLASTEANVFRMYYIDRTVDLETPIVPVGYAMPDKIVCLLNEDGTEVGSGQIGEMVVKSPYMAAGYWAQPDLTESAFQPDATDGSVRCYRTGDLGQFQPNGCLIHLGRKDSQIKLRGHKVVLAEIEIALVKLTDVEEAVVLACEDWHDTPRLIAYVVPTRQSALTLGTLRQALAERLPTYMIPSNFVILTSLPRNANGKVDRLKLQNIDPVALATGPSLALPRTPVEETLANLWAELLELDQVGIHQTFLDLGGHSIIAMQLLARVIETFEVEVPLGALMAAPTIAEMAVVITQHQVAQSDPEIIARLLDEVEGLAEDEIKRRSLTNHGQRAEEQDRRQ